MSLLQPKPKKPTKIALKPQYSDTKVICGLGNSPAEYTNTWHNLGRLFTSYLRKKLVDNGTELSESKFKQTNVYASLDFTAKFLELGTFMNESGQDLGEYLHYFKLTAGQLLLCYDDLDIEFGDYKISFANSPRIHNGVNSVISHLGSDQFWQVRIGANTILKNNYSIRADYILSIITPEYQAQLEPLFEKITNALLVLSY